MVKLSTKGLLAAALIWYSASSSLFAQTQPNAKVLSAFTDSHIEKLKAEGMDIEYLNFVSEKGWYVSDLPKEKIQKGDQVGKISISNVDDINIFSVGLLPKENAYQYLHIEGTDKLLVVMPGFYIRDLMRKNSGK